MLQSRIIISFITQSFKYTVICPKTIIYEIDTALYLSSFQKLGAPLSDMSYYLKLLQYTEILFSPVIISQYIPVAPLSVPNETQLGSLSS